MSTSLYSIHDESANFWLRIHSIDDALALASLLNEAVAWFRARGHTPSGEDDR